MRQPEPQTPTKQPWSLREATRQALVQAIRAEQQAGRFPVFSPDVRGRGDPRR